MTKQQTQKEEKNSFVLTTTQACVAGDLRMKQSTTHVKMDKLLETERFGGCSRRPI